MRLWLCRETLYANKMTHKHCMFTIIQYQKKLNYGQPHFSFSRGFMYLVVFTSKFEQALFSSKVLWSVWFVFMSGCNADFISTRLNSTYSYLSVSCTTVMVITKVFCELQQCKWEFPWQRFEQSNQIEFWNTNGRWKKAKEKVARRIKTSYASTPFHWKRIVDERGKYGIRVSTQSCFLLFVFPPSLFVNIAAHEHVC